MTSVDLSEILLSLFSHRIIIGIQLKLYLHSASDQREKLFQQMLIIFIFRKNQWYYHASQIL
jgi:hypothetical protein